MVQLDAKYREHGLAIWGFPCNQFLYQEPGTDAEIEQFARGKYGVKFDLFHKIKINGEHAIPLFKYLKEHSSLKDPETGEVEDIPWNFGKFFVSPEGQVLNFHLPENFPMEFEGEIRQHLGLEPLAEENPLISLIPEEVQFLF